MYVYCHLPGLLADKQQRIQTFGQLKADVIEDPVALSDLDRSKALRLLLS